MIKTRAILEHLRNMETWLLGVKCIRIPRPKFNQNGKSNESSKKDYRENSKQVANNDTVQISETVTKNLCQSFRDNL